MFEIHPLGGDTIDKSYYLIYYIFLMEKNTPALAERLDNARAKNIGHFIIKDLINAEENDNNFNNNFNKLLKEDILKLETNVANVERFPRPKLAPRAGLPFTDRFRIPQLANPITGNEISELPATTSYLDRVFAQFNLRDAAHKQLGELLKKVPQRNAAGYLLYLVTSGLSVDIVTGYERPHKDVDLVLMHPDVNNHPEFFQTDNVEPHNFWAGMRLEPDFLAGTAFQAAAPKIGRKALVLCAHPGITIVQKTSEAWGRTPREHDIYDATALGYWILSQPEIRQSRDVAIANVALNSMDYIKSSRTADRLNTMFARYGSVRQSIISRQRHPGGLGEHTPVPIPALA
jgi:hypothetical protein